MTDPCPVGRWLPEQIGDPPARTDWCRGPTAPLILWEGEIRKRLRYGVLYEPGLWHGWKGAASDAVFEDHARRIRQWRASGDLACNALDLPALLDLFTLGRECPTCGGRGESLGHAEVNVPCIDCGGIPMTTKGRGRNGTGTIGGVCERHRGMLELQLEREADDLRRTGSGSRIVTSPALTLPAEAGLGMLNTQACEAGLPLEEHLRRIADREAIVTLLGVA